MATSTPKRERLTPTQARAARRQRRSRRRRLYRGAGLAAIATIAVVFIFALFASGLTGVVSIGDRGPGTYIPEPEGYINLVTPHIVKGEPHPPYNSVPATSGWHQFDAEAPARWGVYDTPVADEILVHNLEHAGVGIHYDCPDGCEELVAQLVEIAGPFAKTIVAPYPGMDTRIALTAWNFIDQFEEFDAERILNFIRGHMNSQDAPEPAGF